MGDEPLPLRRGRRIRVFLATVLAVVALDQATKAVVRSLSAGSGRIGTLVPGLLDLVHVENSGAAFGLGEGAGALFAAVAVGVALLALVVVARQDLPLPLVASFACVVGGGLGNMVDRLARGTVTDFISTAFVPFPVFNVADVFVTCGVVASCVGYLAWEARQESA